MNELTLYRKRIIPKECVLLKDDIILFRDENIIITKWNALKPKKNLHHGYSCYLIIRASNLASSIKKIIPCFIGIVIL